MQSKSELFASILASREYSVVSKAEIDGIEYLEGAGLVEVSVVGSLFAENKPSVGACVSRQVHIIIRNAANFSRRAKIRLFSRVELGEQVSEWIPKGVFYIDTRKPDDVTGVLTIHGYDAILLYGGEVYLAEGDVGTWPRAADVVVNDLAARFGLELDERTVIDPSVLVPYPNDWTCRELLGFIGAAHGGNWTVTDAGKLRLVPLWSVPEETFYLVDENGDYITFGGDRIVLGEGAENPNASGAEKVWLGEDMEEYGAPSPFAPFSRVVVWYDDENAFAAGDDTGQTLEVDCPIASQAIAEKILASVKGYAYQPYEAARAVLDPAAELGDGITANGVYSVLARIETTFDALMVSDIAAPADEEIDHEMPYETKMQLALKRKLTLGRDYYGVRITKLGGLQVIKTDSDGNELNRATFNTDVLAMFDDNGQARIFFDTGSGEYVFIGTVNIRGGRMNINDKFVVDEDGNATLTDAWLKAAVLYAGDDSQYYAKMLGDAFALMNKDSDVPRAVLQADSSMVELILGAGSDAGGYNGRLFIQKGVEGGTNVARVRYIDANGRYSTVEFDDTNGITVESEAGVRFMGNVDFSGATVTGITPSV